MYGKRTIYFDEDGNRKVDIRIWDTKQYITKIRKLHNSELHFYAAVRDGIRFVLVEEHNITMCKNTRQKARKQIAIPLYAPINNGTEIIKPFIGFLKAFQQTVTAHEHVPLHDPETAVVRKSNVYTEKELRERREAANDMPDV